ncbi:hypothetical protein jhhlp_005847 [Lomentospora prolificans]|uniref:Carrier domain-containing protein n=1 Tax=Lomentospora prolificans TaxID=41688 RepID=A0A2N3N486_9PEZI|nr:hypothetical protein jhhlp_005847 [Lomentospora prolificans]
MVSISHSELASALGALSLSMDDEIRSTPQFRTILDIAAQDPSSLLASLPIISGGSEKALSLLSLLINETQGKLPVLDLLRCYGSVRKGMPEPVKAGRVPDVMRKLEEVVSKIHNGYECLSDLIEESSRPVLLPPEGVPVVTHAGLKLSVREFRLPLRKEGDKNPVVAIAVPNGPLLAATCVAVAAHFAAAPINPAVGVDQFRADVEQIRAQCIVTTPEIAEKLGLTDRWVSEQNIDIFYVDFTPSHTLALTRQNGSPLSDKGLPFQPNKSSDICLMLFTSGTSGTKKIVPLTMHHVVFGAVLVIDSWGLSSSDICLNMMPLFHIGGLLRNIFAPVLSGGATVCCSAFDPGLFWSVVEKISPTWYYASPTMHSLILSSAPEHQDSRFRLICNAAGGLLPSLALQLKDVFNCTVLPSYGMTECMPISTPPLTYQLDRTGTSGIATGPDLTILDGNDKPLSPHSVGRICVRGEPVSHGYLCDNGVLDKSAFTKDGWFDTGDMGYMDTDGYLYITGRSKEVINRGGEIISPFEVENAIVSAAKQPGSPIFGRVTEALAFSVSHDVLQEVVGIVLVTPSGKPRVDLTVLQEALKSSLHQAKWPSVIVYMDGLPKRNNKVLRIRLADRMSLPTFTDDSLYSDRHWEAICPPDETNLSEKFEAKRCLVEEISVMLALKDCLPENIPLELHVRANPQQGWLEAVAAPVDGAAGDIGTMRATVEQSWLHRVSEKVDNYSIPRRIHWIPRPLPRMHEDPTLVDIPELERVLQDMQQKDADELQYTTEGRVIAKFADITQCEASMIQPDLDFFSLGGDSLKAGKLIAALRSEFNVAVPISMVFSDGTPRAIARYIDDACSQATSIMSEKGDGLPGCEKTYSSTRLWLMLLQLVPMVVVYPFRRAMQWTWFMVALSYTQPWSTNKWLLGRLFNLTVSILFAQVVTRVIIPWVGILSKWIIIGRYKEGLYPMWGQYHTRWWLVQKIVDVCGPGCFSWSSCTKIMYYRLMGAKIGKNVDLTKVRIGEWDLVEIGDNAVLEGCICRPFGAERNTSMYLGRIVIGSGATVGVASIVAPGTTVPDNTCIGPNSSSWALEDASEENRDLLPGARPKAHWLLVILFTVPLQLLSWIITLLPWVAGLIGLVITSPDDSENVLYEILVWFADTQRVGFHYLALVLRASLSPFIAFGFAVTVKWILDKLFGELKPGPAKGRSQFATWRAELMRTLMPSSRLHEMTEMMGQHYEGTSIAVRLLGGKVGKRVYWPGTGPAVGDYHLVDVGDDVVFGSRSHFITSDGTSSEPVVIGNNAMIADRVTLLPGVTVGDGTTMGSGALTRRNGLYSPGGTYVGSKGGDAVCLSLTRQNSMADLLKSNERSSEKSTLTSGNSSVATSIHDGKTDDEPESSPFGRAFYFKKAPYHVMGPFAIFCYSSFLTVATRFYWNVPSISSIQILNVLLRETPHVSGLALRFHWSDPFVLLGWTTAFVAALTTIQAVVALLFVIASKWILLGRRQPGNYDWDKSSYCQRWQLFLAIERIRRSCYRGSGILGMLTGTHWIVMYFRALGAKIGKDCALFANGSPSLYFTEPDLLTLGDRVVVDDASIVGHINTRGKFDLNRLSVGNRCVLRTGSRLLSGAHMLDDSCLMEHTLVMSGDVVGEGETLQGWPAGVFNGRRVKNF